MARVRFLIILLACAACSEGSGEPAAERDRKLGEMDEAELEQLCQEVEAEVQADQAYLEVLCTNSALFTQNFRGDSCEETLAACLTSPPPTCFKDELSAVPWERFCPDASAGMWTDCMRGARELSKEVYGDLSCDSTWLGEGDTLLDFTSLLQVQVPSQCQAFLKACPAFFGAAAPSAAE